MIARLAAIALALWLAPGCRSEPNPFLAAAPRNEPVPAGIAAACDLARTRCSRCHSVDRILAASLREPAEWQRYVRRMRLMPGSAIKTVEEPTLVRCFVFQTTGNAGLRRLSEEFP